MLSSRSLFAIRWLRYWKVVLMRRWPYRSETRIELVVVVVADLVELKWRVFKCSTPLHPHWFCVSSYDLCAIELLLVDPLIGAEQHDHREVLVVGGLRFSSRTVMSCFPGRANNSILERRTCRALETSRSMFAADDLYIVIAQLVLSPPVSADSPSCPCSLPSTCLLNFL